MTALCKNLAGLQRPPLRLAIRQLQPDWSVVIGGFKVSIAWTFKILIPAAVAASVGSAINVWVGHLLGK